LARIEQGASWLVGARPGGAGKTTIMAAFLAMLPAGTRVRVTDENSDWDQAEPGECLVAYEISPGHYDGYVWGARVRRLLALGAAGCRLVSNLHADTVEEAQDQVVGQCGASDQQFGLFSLFLPIELGGSTGRVRRVGCILAYEQGAWRPLDVSAPTSREQVIGDFLDRCLACRRRRVEEVRAAWQEQNAGS
jgi:hypothetical protein